MRWKLKLKKHLDMVHLLKLYRVPNNYNKIKICTASFSPYVYIYIYTYLENVNTYIAYILVWLFGFCLLKPEFSCCFALILTGLCFSFSYTFTLISSVLDIKHHCRVDVKSCYKVLYKSHGILKRLKSHSYRNYFY